MLSSITLTTPRSGRQLVDSTLSVSTIMLGRLAITRVYVDTQN